VFSPDCDKGNRYATSHNEVKTRIIGLSGTAPLSDVNDPSQMSHSRTVCRTLDSGQQISTPRRRTGTGASARTSRPTWKPGVQRIAQACVRYCLYRIADRRAKRCSAEHQEDHMAFPGIRAPRPAIAEDCGRLVICFSFPKHHLGGEEGSEELISGITTTFATSGT
jgi:hypothetical protein